MSAEPLTPEELDAFLCYIEGSPSPENGGFDPNLVQAAKQARARIAELERENVRDTAEIERLACTLTDARNDLLREGMERDEARAQVERLKAASEFNHDAMLRAKERERQAEIGLLRKIKDSLERAEQRIAELVDQRNEWMRRAENKAWPDSPTSFVEKEIIRERDEARAEVERLKAAVEHGQYGTADTMSIATARVINEDNARMRPVVEAARELKEADKDGAALDDVEDEVEVTRAILRARNKLYAAVDAYRAQEDEK